MTSILLETDVLKREYNDCDGGGSHHTCDYVGDSGFFGCCKDSDKYGNNVDPCSSNGCGFYFVTQMHFDPNGQQPNVTIFECPQDPGFPAEPYSCNQDGNTFFGCCKTDPCENNSVCPNQDLGDTYLKKEFITARGNRPTSTSGAAATVTSVSLATTGSTDSQNPTSPGVVVGVTLGAIAVVATMVMLAILLYRKGKWSNHRDQQAQVTSENSMYEVDEDDTIHQAPMPQRKPQ